jgi:hypothetical protein
MESVTLKHYFVKPSTIDRIRSSWLGSQIESYVEWMEVHGYARPTVVRSHLSVAVLKFPGASATAANEVHRFHFYRRKYLGR